MGDQKQTGKYNQEEQHQKTPSTFRQKRKRTSLVIHLEKKAPKKKKRPNQVQTNIAAKDVSFEGIGAKFEWDIDSTKEEQVDEEDAKDKMHKMEQIKKKEKRQSKKERELQEEKVTQQMEKKLLEERPPESKEEFEKLVFAYPNSSFSWIKYMAFWIGIGELEIARSTADRALQRIFQAGEKKKNVWVAYLNLENTYGTDESLEIVYKKALLVNDEKEIHLELIDIYVRSEKYEQAEVIYKSVLKKYKQSKKVWIKRCMYLFTRQKYQQVRKEFTLALECLPKKKATGTHT